MPKSCISSIIFALLTCTSVAVSAAPAATPAPTMPPVAVAAQAEQGAKVNLNTATVDTLQKELSGVGAGKASAIVAYRDEHGSFTSVEELVEVKGIGKSLLDKNRDRLSIE